MDWHLRHATYWDIQCVQSAWSRNLFWSQENQSHWAVILKKIGNCWIPVGTQWRWRSRMKLTFQLRCIDMVKSILGIGTLLYMLRPMLADIRMSATLFWAKVRPLSVPPKQIRQVGWESSSQCFGSKKWIGFCFPGFVTEKREEKEKKQKTTLGGRPPKKNNM